MQIQVIQNLIYEIRGQKVMLDFDLAALYGVETRVLNQAVKRNKGRFPKDFMFQLTRQELTNLKSQFVTSSWGGIRKLPYAFTEHGVTMLANVLKSKKAMKLSIVVVRAFISLKQFVLQHKDIGTQLKELREELYDRLGEHDTQLAAIYDAIENLLEDPSLRSGPEEKKWKERPKVGFRRKDEE